MSKHRIAALAIITLCAALGRAGPVVAQQADPPRGDSAAEASSSEQPVLKEVIVTAQKRSQNEQDVPITISALSGDQLANLGIESTQDLSAASPGVSITQFGGVPATTDINIRGIAQLDFGDQQESPNALYLDGAYISFQGAGGLGLYDVKQLTVLRGPQGTLFGRNATGGLVDITSNGPTNYKTGYLQMGYGSYNQLQTEGALSGPISERLDARLAFSYTHQDPYFHNSLGPSIGADNTLNARLQTQYKLSQETENTTELFATRTFPIAAGIYHPYPTAPDPGNHGLSAVTSGPSFVQNCAALGFTVAPGATNCFGYVANTSPWQTADLAVGNFERILAGVTNTLTHEMASLKVTNITSYTYYDKRYIEDDSAGPNLIYGYAANTNSYQASDEFRLNGDTQKAHWVAGLYVLTIHGHYEQPTLFGPIYSPSVITGPWYTQNVWTYALYDQLSYAFTPQWTLTLGERIERDRKHMDLTAVCLPDPVTCGSFGLIPSTEFVSGTAADTEWSGNLQLSYKPVSDVMFYAGIRRGTKGAELEVPFEPFANTPIPFDSLIVKPEILTDSELGFKSTLFRHRLRLNGDIFYYNYNDYQAYKFVGLSPVLFNAQARDYGAELSASALLTATLQGGISVAYLHTRVMGVTLPDGYVSNSEQQPDAPRFSATANLRKDWYTGIGTIFVNGSVNYLGSRYFSTVNEPSVLAPSYVTENASIGLVSKSGKWTSTLSIDNITNRAVQVYMLDLSSTAGYGEESFAPPRWVSWQLRYSF